MCSKKRILLNLEKRVFNSINMSRLIKIPLGTLQTLQNCRFLGTSHSTNNNQKRERLVILGTGWGSFATLKNACKKKYDITVVSPRNYFLFTPMLPMVTVGTVDSRSIIDPIRDGYKFRDSNDYQCAYVTKIDTKKRELTCKSALDMKDDYRVVLQKCHENWHMKIDPCKKGLFLTPKMT